MSEDVHADPAVSRLRSDRAERLKAFREAYFSTPPDRISQLAADAMIVVIDLEAQIRDLLAAPSPPPERAKNLPVQDPAYPIGIANPGMPAYVDPNHDPDVCGCENHAPWCPYNPNASEVTPLPAAPAVEAHQQHERQREDLARVDEQPLSETAELPQRPTEDAPPTAPEKDKY